MKCDRCPEVRAKIKDAAFERVDDKSFWKSLCLECFHEIDPIYRKQGIEVGKSYRILKRRGQLDALATMIGGE